MPTGSGLGAWRRRLTAVCATTEPSTWVSWRNELGQRAPCACRRAGSTGALEMEIAQAVTAVFCCSDIKC